MDVLKMDKIKMKYSKNRNVRFKKRNRFIKKRLGSNLHQSSHRIDNLTWMNMHYRILHDFALICSKTLDVDTLLKQAYKKVSEVMPTDCFYLASYNEGEDFFNILLLVDMGECLKPFAVKIGENNGSRVIKSRQTIHHRIESDDKGERLIIGTEDTISHIFVPIIIEDKVRGIISAQSRKAFAYRKEHEELLQIIGGQVLASLETARLYETIKKMSYTDDLTGLKNRRAFHDDLSLLLNRDNPFASIVMLDLDNFKSVNDQYGHDIGDLYLKRFTEGIKSLCNEKVEGYRYAGDEFMLIINDPSIIQNEFLSKLTKFCKEQPLILVEKDLFISFSSGVAVYPFDGNSIDVLKKSADVSLYSSKSRRKINR
jgi:diguanylate cyclase (GGDEF)-like protein